MEHDRITAITLAQAVWMLLSLLGLVYFGALTLESYFIVSYIGFLVVMQVFAPVEGSPRWWSILQVIAFIGLLIFAFIIYTWIVGVL